MNHNSGATWAAWRWTSGDKNSDVSLERISATKERLLTRRLQPGSSRRDKSFPPYYHSYTAVCSAAFFSCLATRRSRSIARWSAVKPLKWSLEIALLDPHLGLPPGMHAPEPRQKGGCVPRDAGCMCWSLGDLSALTYERRYCRFRSAYSNESHSSLILSTNARQRQDAIWTQARAPAQVKIKWTITTTHPKSCNPRCQPATDPECES